MNLLLNFQGSNKQAFAAFRCQVPFRSADMVPIFLEQLHHHLNCIDQLVGISWSKVEVD